MHAENSNKENWKKIISKEKRKYCELFIAMNFWYGTLSLFWIVTSPFFLLKCTDIPD